MRRTGLNSIIYLVILIALAGGVSAMWLYMELSTPYYGTTNNETFVDIPRGVTTSAIANRLVAAGILHNRLPFILHLGWTGAVRRVQAGEYRFAAPATPVQVAEKLVRGDVYFHSITVPEGLTARETVELVAASGIGIRDEMEKHLRDVDLIHDFDPEARDLEGYLFPETYRFGRKTSSRDVIVAMVQEFRLRFAKTTSQDPLPDGWKASHVVILASMIEKEAKKSEERPLVASVLVNRIDRRMPLACDATVIYALKMSGVYDGNLRRKDLSVDSPYNTYLRPGLPPGPIANPGEDSLRAALKPAKTKYLYYVSRNDGTHQFSTDLASHVAAVNKYQRHYAHKPEPSIKSAD